MFTSTRSKLTSTILAGTLALGMVPMVAFADDEPDVVDDPAVEVVTTDSEEVVSVDESEPVEGVTPLVMNSVVPFDAEGSTIVSTLKADVTVFASIPQAISAGYGDAAYWNQEAWGNDFVVPVHVGITGTPSENQGLMVVLTINGVQYGTAVSYQELTYLIENDYTGFNYSLAGMGSDGGQVQYVNYGNGWESAKGVSMPSLEGMVDITYSAFTFTADADWDTSDDYFPAVPQMTDVITIVSPTTTSVTNDNKPEPLPPVQQLIFFDVPSDAWYYDACYAAADLDFMHGYRLGYFGPTDNIDRQQIATVLYNMKGNGAPISHLVAHFSDVNTGDWGYPYIAWCEDTGLMGGYGNGVFGIHDNLTREQLMTVMWNISGNPKMDANEVDQIINYFPDADTVSDWAKPAVAWCVKNNIVNGSLQNGTRYIQGDQSITRAEVAQITVNYHNKFMMD